MEPRARRCLWWAALLLLAASLLEAEAGHARRRPTESRRLAAQHRIRHAQQRLKRQHAHVDRLLTDSYVVAGAEGVATAAAAAAAQQPEEGQWGPWSPPSDCSRSCGGGVASQTRLCQDPRGPDACRGGSKRYFSCNIQDCPEDAKDFRAEQCSEFDKEPFENRYFTWVPYTKAANPCELNCMPRGERFYYRHKQAVIDGTRCNDEKLDVCVEGQCLPVGCDMLLGSTAVEDKCRECRGDGSGCNTIEGLLDTDDLQVGYNDILLIPAGATNIRVHELKASSNYLAIRNESGYYYLNGNWRIDFPRSLKFAGTIFHYERVPHAFLAPESISALGPTKEAVYIVLLYQGTNPGIHYEYSIPKGVSQPTDPDSYTWIPGEFTECSVTCGGGFQLRNVSCIRRKDGIVVSNDLCDPSLEPRKNESCGTDPCLPEWSVGDWGSCSASCGGGVQTRQVYCERIVSNNLPSIVDDEQCLELLGPKPLTTQPCNQDLVCPTWHIGPWRPCDRLCGEGKHRRRVRCYRRVDGRIEVLDDSACSPEKPEDEKPCLLRPCEGVDWMLSEWSGCENKCGLTFETREAHCVNEAGVIYPEKFCQQYLLEELKRPCTSPRPCDHEWFASQWSECSAECGTGIQTRKVFCGSFDGDTVKRVDDEKCDLSKKYEDVRNCTGKEECLGQWYHGPWSKCDKECGGGTKVRQVLCLVANETADVNKCDADKFPFTTETCNNHQCSEDAVIPADDGVSLEEECEEDEEIYFTTDTVLDTASMGKTESPDSIKDTVMTSEVGTVSADGLSSQTSAATAMTDGAVSGLSSVSAVSLSESDADTRGSPESSFSTAAMADEELMLSDAASTYEDGDTGYTTDSYDETTDDFGSTDVSFTDEPDSFLDTSESVGTSSEAPLTTSVPETTSGEELKSTETSSSTDSQSVSSSLAPDITSVGSTASDSDGSTVNLYETSVVPDTTSSVDSTTIESITASGSAETTNGETETTSETTDTSGSMTTDSETESSSTDTSSSRVSDESSSTPTAESTSESSNPSTVSSAATSEISTTTATSDAEDETDAPIVDEFDPSELERQDKTMPQQTTEESSTAYSEVSTDEPSSSYSESSSLIPPSTSESQSSSLIPGSSTEVSVSTSEPEVSQSTEISTPQESTGTEVLTSTEVLMTTEVSASTETLETTEESVSETSMATTVSPAEGTSISPETSVSEETASSVAQTTSETPEETSEVASTTTDEIFTGSTGILDYSSTEEAAVTTKKESLWETATTLRDLITTIKSKGKKCRRKKKPRELKCEETKFGCCADGITKAQGPFSLGCPQLRTCDETKYGCCPDKVSPAKGPNWKGCPPSLCAETLFGCCPDNVSIAEGNDFEGCPEEELTFDCKTSEFGCCPDGITKASGPNNTGCFECEGSGECTCADTKFGCCPDGVKAATGPNDAGCDEEFEGSGVTPFMNATETEIDCTASEHGCCPDGYRPATGPYFKGCDVIDAENCTASYFGCCPDQINPALGPDYIGCRMPCESEKYGCCRDGITPAHGPNEEGCCLNSEFGCCPDNVLPAQGPNLEGCGCDYTRYRCCPDNKTAARGPDNEGCGCKYTKHGCCPNNYTPAAGPNFEGCPCHTFQFGCCPDGITIARGLHNQGCGCENTEFGCCSDDKTPALGPNKEGCGCEASKYGCCPDGVSEAEGEKFEGCEDAPIIASEICTLPKSRGSCRDFTVKWFFDTEYGGCSRFWYGGCEGNDNRFKTQDECKSVCVEPPGREACFLPKIAGPCEGYYPTWYYDSERKQCGQFIYGGCLGNNNKFQTREECEELCVLPDTIDACEQQKDEGPCRGNYRRWFFNKENGVCEEFSYGGCKGNRNNFLTEAACHQQCLQPGRSRESCSLPRDEGNCTDRIPRWFFDVSENRCMPFYYSGCGGNTNRFETETECEADCPPKIEQDICSLKPVVGDQCYNYTERWYYDSYEVRCRQFYYTGCGGNENNFLTLQDCENRCEKRILTSVPAAEFRKESCFLPDEHGPCSESMAKWFYDSRDGVCKQFLYGGCEGNDNRFSSRQECEEKCGDVQDICNLPRVVGPCSGSIRQWYYDRATDSCYEFDYGGCQGNKNKFDDKQQCEHYCKRYHYTTSAPDVSALLLTTQDPGMNEIYNSTDICSAPVDPGPCQDSIVSWYYDERVGRCASFAYGGCGGNANRFQSEEQCERQCGAFKGQDVCNIQHEEGYCQDAFQKWYYDGSSRSCRPFSYTGCGGNGNRFSSQEECESVCLQYQEVHPHGNDTALSRQAICRLPVDSGPCSGGYHKRWYYDDERQTCIPFIYTGCGGNFNRFKNFQSCLSFCSIVMEGGYYDKAEDKPEEKVDCTSAKENCNLLQCPYGIERFVNADSCEICQCHEPCKDHICPDGSRCAVDLYQNNETDDTEFRAVCRPVNKLGECPKLVEANENCIQECQSDADCTDIRKCCFSGCGSSCLNPIYPEQLLTTERPVVQPQPPYGLYDEPPSIDLTESDVQAEEGSYATLKCIAQGRPTPRIVWRKGTSTIDGSSGRYRLLLDGSLQIIGLYRSDAGVYICTADNGVGQPAQKETHLKVTDPHPRPAEIIGEDSTYVVVTLGAPTSLHCYAVGWPRPSVTWWRGERLLPLSSEQYEQRRDYSLLIRSVALRQLGPYTCQAYNGQGKATSWTVTVQAIGPVYSNNPIDRDYFQFLVSAPRRAPERNKTESPQSRPSYPYRPVRPPYRPRPPVTQTIPAMTMTTTTTTTTPQPIKEDENIVVPEEPRVFIVPVQVNVTVDRTVYPVGSEISIACDVDGYPIPQVQWFKDDNPLQIGNRIQVSESHRLLISRAEGGDSGTYRCAASNQYSASSSTVSIVVEGIYVHPNCTDNPFFANCSLIVKGQYCTHKYYAHFCCKSCTLAGQLPSYGPHLERTGTSRIDGRRK